MPRLRVLPHAALCPDGAEFDAPAGETLCNLLLAHGIQIEHACEKSCACTTCHVLVREGFEALAPAEEKEEDMLDKAWGLEPASRLACQARMPASGVVLELPKYTINYEREGGGKK
jgi:2Fe-2S ferredoxin